MVYKCRDGGTLFGMSLAADDSTFVPTLVVGAPGVAAAYVYTFDVPNVHPEDPGCEMVPLLELGRNSLVLRPRLLFEETTFLRTSMLWDCTDTTQLLVRKV